jgi:hypothetical protein
MLEDASNDIFGKLAVSARENRLPQRRFYNLIGRLFADIDLVEHAKRQLPCLAARIFVRGLRRSAS